MNPALSVAIPAHNEERLIGRCIQSIRRSADLAGQIFEGRHRQAAHHVYDDAER